MKRLTAILGLVAVVVGCKDELSGPTRATVDWLMWAWQEGHIRTAINYGTAAINTFGIVLHYLSDLTGADPLVIVGSFLIGISFSKRLLSLVAMSKRLLPKREVSDATQIILKEMAYSVGWKMRKDGKVIVLDKGKLLRYRYDVPECVYFDLSEKEHSWKICTIKTKYEKNLIFNAAQSIVKQLEQEAANQAAVDLVTTLSNNNSGSIGVKNIKAFIQKM